MHPPGPSPAIAPETVKYVVRSSDVISDNKVNVYQEGSERVLWYKEAFLTDDEIVEHVVDNATSALLWTIHRPLRGWYIRLRAPTFPPTSYVSLLPVPKASPSYALAALSFSCRTLVPRASPLPSPFETPELAPVASPPKASLDSEATLAEQLTPTPTSPSHTYPPPPTPPAVFLSPPSPSSVNAKLDQVTLARQRTQISTFVLTPHAQPPARDDGGGLFARVARAFRNNSPTISNSFSVLPMPLTPLPTSPTPTPTLSASTSQAPILAPGRNPHLHLSQLPEGDAPGPILVFHDTTPVFTLSTSSGIFELNLEEIGKLGVDVGFWIAVALAYGEFLGDREAYLAAVTD